MSDVELVAIDARVRTQWRVEWLGLAVPIVLVVAVVLIVTPVSLAIAVSVSVALALLLIGGGLWYVNVQFRHWRYGLGDDVLVLQSGVWTRRLSMTPYFRVQNVDVTAGPFERRLGLKRLTISTASAATDASIPGLDADDADRLRERILKRAGRDAAV